ncbi:MAG: hypothetical protein AB8B51_22380 [Sedimentitalea sp.]
MGLSPVMNLDSRRGRAGIGRDPTILIVTTARKGRGRTLGDIVV